MKVLPINNNINKNINFEGANKTCKYGITSLIASASLFMASNAFDSFNKEEPRAEKTALTYMDAAASVFGILGTCLSLIGIKQPDTGSNFKHL